MESFTRRTSSRVCATTSTFSFRCRAARYSITTASCRASGDSSRTHPSASSRSKESNARPVAAFFTAVLQEENATLLLQNRIRLRQLITRYFSKHELESLLFDLGIDKDEFPEGVKSDMAQEIILYCERHGRMADLLELCRQQRPNADWPETL